MSDMYKAAGVDVAAGDAMSAYAGSVTRKSSGNSRFVNVHNLSAGQFRGLRPFDLVGLPDGSALVLGADGVGTKVVLHSAIGTEGFAPQDAIAMTGGDHTRYGALPLIFSSVLDVATLGEPDSRSFARFKELFDGLGEAALKEQVALIGGETAELGVCVGSPNARATTKFNLAGFMIGAYHPDFAVTGRDIAPGQVIVALHEPGFRSNGISAVRKALAYRFGDTWWEELEARSPIWDACLPSELYDPFLTSVNGWHGGTRIPVTGIAHITGGGIPSKFGDLLRITGHSAILDTLYDPPAIAKSCAAWIGEGRAKDGTGGPVTSYEAYRTWGCGQGVLAVMDEAHVESFVECALFKHSIAAQVCGRIVPTDGKQRITVHSRFDGDIVDFEIE